MTCSRPRAECVGQRARLSALQWSSGSFRTQGIALPHLNSMLLAFARFQHELMGSELVMTRLGGVNPYAELLAQARCLLTAERVACVLRS